MYEQLTLMYIFYSVGNNLIIGGLLQLYLFII